MQAEVDRHAPNAPTLDLQPDGIYSTRQVLPATVRRHQSTDLSHAQLCGGRSDGALADHALRWGRCGSDAVLTLCQKDSCEAQRSKEVQKRLGCAHGRDQSG
jgi:hypothetical protein